MWQVNAGLQRAMPSPMKSAMTCYPFLGGRVGFDEADSWSTSTGSAVSTEALVVSSLWLVFFCGGLRSVFVTLRYVIKVIPVWGLRVS
jgi:hypothetical protein